jgi:hypothetical protein
MYKGTSADDAYWYSVSGNDATSPVTQYRFFNNRYVNPSMKNVPVAVDDEFKDRYTIEHLGSGTYLIYYRVSAKEYRFLACSEDGSWGVMRYTNTEGDGYPPVSQIKTDLPKLKVKLYAYEQQSTTKKLDFSGATVFNVEKGTTTQELVEYIQQNIVVKNSNSRHKLAIPGSGTDAKVGYYWLKFDNPFDSTSDGYNAYTVTVKYRNDDGTDTDITNLTVNVIEPELTFAGQTVYEVAEGTSELAVRELIESQITVTNTFDSSKVAYSGNAATPGYYWLDFDSKFDSSETGSHNYLVTVKYRKNDGSDIEVQTLKVIVKAKTISTIELCIPTVKALFTRTPA